MAEEILRSLPVEILRQLPDGVGKDPAKLRAALRALPLETLQGIGKDRAPAENEPLSAEDQLHAAAPTIARTFGGPLGPLVAEPAVAAGKALKAAVTEPTSKEGFLADLKRHYEESIEHGKEVATKVSPEDAHAMITRSAAEGATLGLSEPLVSGAKAAFKTLTDGGDLKDNYKKDVAEREASQAKMPLADMGAQGAGMLAAPFGMFRGAAMKALGKIAPEAAAALAKTTEGAVKGEGFLKGLGKEALAVAGEGAKGATDIAEQEAARSLTLKPSGFVGPDEPSVGDAAKTGAEFSGGLRAGVAGLKGAGAVAGAVGKFLAPVFLSGPRGFTSKDMDYYLDNFKRLKGKEANFAEVSDAIGDAVNKIREDFNASKLDEAHAKEALNRVEEQIKIAKGDEKLELRQQIAEAKQKLNVDFQEQKASQRAFAKAMPRGMADEVQNAVGDARQAVVDAHKEKLGILASSKEPISISGISDTIDQAIGHLNTMGSDELGAFGQEAKAAQNKLLDYKQSLEALEKKFGPNIPADQAYKLVNQIDNDVNYFSSLTGFKDTADATMTRVRGDLQNRIVDAVPGYGDALAKNREAGRFLDQVTEHFDNPEKIHSTLNNIHTDSKYLARGVLRDLGDRTGRDFNSTIEASARASEAAKSPAALAAVKEEMAREAGIPDLEAQLERNPVRAAKQIREEMERTPEYAAHQAAIDARQKAQELDNLFAGFSDMTVDGKVKAVMAGKEAVKRQMQALSALSDQDFLQHIEDLKVLGNFGKSSFNGSRRVNLFSAIGYAASSNANPEKRITMLGLGAAAGSILDMYGPKLARSILDGIGNIQGMVTADKLEALPLPDSIKKDLYQQFARAMFYGGRASFKPNVNLSPEEAMMVKQEIDQSKSMSNADKALSISGINKTGQFTDVNKLLLGNRPVPPPEQQPKPAVAPTLEQVTARARRR